MFMAVQSMVCVCVFFLVGKLFFCGGIIHQGGCCTIEEADGLGLDSTQG